MTPTLFHKAFWVAAVIATVASCQPIPADTLRMSEERRKLNFGEQAVMEFEPRFHALNEEPVRESRGYRPHPIAKLFTAPSVPFE